MPRAIRLILATDTTETECGECEHKSNFGASGTQCLPFGKPLMGAVLMRISECIAAEEERKEIWICQACGKSADQRDKVGDESCYLNAVKCWADSIVRDETGKIKSAEAV